uniref:Troponin I type 2a (skeletal, fast), tandem duplicate 1 n=1 Tax=Oncorhynchus mykiss TaxID=8022 RepID=A0A8C7UJB2_ONCMY
MSEKKMNSSRRGHLKSLMLAIAKDLLEKEAADLITEKAAFIAENCPAPVLSGGLPELQEMLKKLAQTIDKVDEDRYDAEAKVKKTDKEIEDLKMKVVEIQGIKKPALKKVRMSADAMLAALLGTKHKVTMDFRANLKEVKKEVKEEAADAVGDWRKNVDEQAGMDGRKKKFQG